MNIAFRTDASIQIGTGHVMRCLTLATRLRERGGHALFVCRELPGHLCDLIQTKDFIVHRLSEPHGEPLSLSFQQQNKHAQWLGLDWEIDAAQTEVALRKAGNKIDWLVVDHYALDRWWEARMRQSVKNIMVIDDLANRPHDCDLLLDQNLYPNLERRYDGLVPNYCRKFLGPRYALLRPEFLEAKNHLTQRDGGIRRILVFLGGGDPGNITTKALDALDKIRAQGIFINVVIGEANPNNEAIRGRCLSMPNTTCHTQVENMAGLMLEADLCIGAGGATTWERCFLGLPTITVITADNQIETTRAVTAAGATWNLGLGDRVTADDLANAISKALSRTDEMQEMAQRAQSIMRGLDNGESILASILRSDSTANPRTQQVP